VHKSHGFTLIELLIVMAVLGVLATGLVLLINPAAQFEKARDAKRQNDFEQLHTAAEFFYNDHNYYPPSIPFGSAWNENETVYMAQTPQDPDCHGGTQNCTPYTYIADPSNPSQPQWYVLYGKLVVPPQGSSPACTIPCVPATSSGFNSCVYAGNVDCTALAGVLPNSSTPSSVGIPTPIPVQNPIPIPTAVPLPTLSPTSAPFPSDGYGLYEACSPIYDTQYNSYCAKRLQQMGTGGFKLVLNYNALSTNSTASQIITYADEAEKYGLKVIWGIGNNHQFFNGSDLRATFPALAATCNCTDNTTFTQYVINLLKNHPATWGYYVGDEIPVSTHTQWLAFSTIVHRTDPHHPRLLILATNAHSYGNTDLTTFADGAEVLGQDYYPIGVDYMVPYTQTGMVVQGMQSIVDQAQRQSAMALQAVSWQDYYPPARCTPYPSCAPFPSLGQLQVMLSQTLANAHPRLILWYSYYDILKSDNPTGHWNDLVSTITSGRK